MKVPSNAHILEAQLQELEKGILRGWDGGNRVFNGPVSPEDQEGQDLLHYELNRVRSSLQQVQDVPIHSRFALLE